MQTKSSVAQLSSRSTLQAARSRFLLPLVILLAMECAFILVGAILPLYGLWFTTSQLADLSQWLLLPTRLLFPGQPLNPTLFHFYDAPPPFLDQSWRATVWLFGSFACVLLVYLLALRYLPQRISCRYILISVLLLGLTSALIPNVTSPDLYSYISYARMGVLYHLNPLTTIPKAIRSDAVYPLLYWVDQPSAYGPTWALITSALQWITNIFGTEKLAPMVLALRLLALAAHLWSTLLVWSIGGSLQRSQGFRSQRLRTLATLAFAWNPLLLFEASVNAHNDAVVLLFLLLALWFIVRATPSSRDYLYATLMLALGTCLKVNVALLFPGLLLFLLTQPHKLRRISTVTAIYVGVIVLLYAPFWQQGQLLVVLRVNPGTNRDINTLADFLTRLYNSITQLFGAAPAPEIGSFAENITRTLSLLLFILLYGLLCWRSLRAPGSINTPLALIRWMTIAWFLYTIVGAPWFWPWYTVIFFGLFALIEAASKDNGQLSLRGPNWLRLPLATRLFAFSLLSLYCIYTWAPYATPLPGLAGSRWAYVRGLWVWLVPLLIMLFNLPALARWFSRRQKA